MGSQKEEHGKWAALLQPIKDLEKNWCVDIAGELTDYLEDLSGLTFEVDGLSNLNFAEAALVVHSSSCTYGKKVEYLMKLTTAALEAAKSKHKGSTGNARSKQVRFDIVWPQGGSTFAGRAGRPAQREVIAGRCSVTYAVLRDHTSVRLGTCCWPGGFCPAQTPSCRGEHLRPPQCSSIS